MDFPGVAPELLEHRFGPMIGRTYKINRWYALLDVRTNFRELALHDCYEGNFLKGRRQSVPEMNYKDTLKELESEIKDPSDLICCRHMKIAQKEGDWEEAKKLWNAIRSLKLKRDKNVLRFMKIKLNEMHWKGILGRLTHSDSTLYSKPSYCISDELEEDETCKSWNQTVPADQLCSSTRQSRHIISADDDIEFLLPGSVTSLSAASLADKKRNYNYEGYENLTSETEESTLGSDKTFPPEIKVNEMEAKGIAGRRCFSDSALYRKPCYYTSDEFEKNSSTEDSEQTEGEEKTEYTPSQFDSEEADVKKKKSIWTKILGWFICK